MKLFTLMLAARAPAKEPVPFNAILPFKLKPEVSGKGSKSSEVCCIYEMSVMFACLKNSEFEQSPCTKEIDSFQKCYYKHLEEKTARKDKESKGILIAGEKKMSAKQLNLLLRRYPNF